jgi:hypothetical protein
MPQRYSAMLWHIPEGIGGSVGDDDRRMGSGAVRTRTWPDRQLLYLFGALWWKIWSRGNVEMLVIMID